MKKIILLLFLIIISCTNTNRLLLKEAKTKNFLTDQNKSEFILKFDTITSFEWDELLLAGPYMNLDSIEGYNFNNIPNTIKSNDQFILFSFIKEKKGIKYMEIERYLFSDKNFETKMLGRIYSKAESKFVINKE